MLLTVKQVQEFKTLNRTEIECVFKNISGILDFGMLAIQL